MKKIIAFIFMMSIPIVWICYILFSDSPLQSKFDYQTDFARIETAIIDREVHVFNISEIQTLIQQASSKNQKISIAGKKYSGGGHTFTEDGLVIDMGEFNNILNYSPNHKKITVQSGVTWGEIQKYINKDNLSIKVMQSSNIFSLGGSLSSNVHGRDPRHGTIADTIDSFRLINAQGELLDVSYEENPDLFSSVIGGFGLFGVVTDVTLSLQKDEVFSRTTKKVSGVEYETYLRENIIDNSQIGLHYGRYSIAKGDNFLKEFYVTDYSVTDQGVNSELMEESWVLRNRFFLNLSRKYDWGKKIRWELQKKFTDNIHTEKKISRNNAMNPPIRFISYYSKTHTDILHEYFIPLENYNVFMKTFREVMVENDVNLLNITTRYIKKSDKQVILDYNPQDMISIVLYMNVGLDETQQSKLKKYTQKLIDTANNLGGTYYLVYQNFATQEQLEKSYPQYNKFKQLKKKYDPQELFSNIFYEKNFK